MAGKKANCKGRPLLDNFRKQVAILAVSSNTITVSNCKLYVTRLCLIYGPSTTQKVGGGGKGAGSKVVGVENTAIPNLCHN